MFEDAATKSWWRQVNGEAVIGPLQGKMLAEIPAEQMRLDVWTRQHPKTRIMQPDSTFAEQYDGLKNYDEGKDQSHLTRSDSLSWQDKSWIAGVQLGGAARAYDWNDLIARRVINDTLAGAAIVVVVEDDSASFHVWRRDSLRFIFDTSASLLKDERTYSSWNWRGECVDGALAGSRLEAVQSYQEFWHSWRTFRSQTTRFGASD